MALAQRRHVDRVVDDESGLNQLLFAVFAEDRVDQFAFAHRLVDFDVQFFACFTQLFFAFAGDIEAGFLADRVGHRQAAERAGETDFAAVDHYLGLAVQCNGDPFEHLFDELHHPDVVLVSDVDLHHRELGVVRTVHPFVAEVLAELVHAVETSYDQTFEIQFIGDAQVERDVQCVVVRDERPGRRSAGNWLQDRRLHLEVAPLVEELAHRVDDLTPLEERILDLRIDDQVDVALAVALFRIAEGIVYFAVFLLDYGQRAQRFAQQRKSLAMNGQFTGLGDEDETFDPDDIADVEQFLEHLVVEGRFGIASAHFVTFDVDLDFAGMVLQFEERCAAHDPAAHDAAGQ